MFDVYGDFNDEEDFVDFDMDDLEDAEDEGEDDDIFDGDGDDFVERYAFAEPGGNSALRASSPSNPRNLPCPTCETPSVLTPADVRRGYQCDRCADYAEYGRGY